MARKTQLEILRGIEKQLSEELTRLRALIRAAERGENKRIKDSNKYIAKQLRSIERTTKASEKIREQELEKLEKFLGESFETLEEARSSFSKSTSKLVGKTLNKFLDTERQKRLAARERIRERKKQREIEEHPERGISGFERTKTQIGPTVRKLRPNEAQRVLDFITDRRDWNTSQPWKLQPSEKLGITVTYRYHAANDPFGRLHTGRAFGLKFVNSWEELREYINTYAEADNYGDSDTLDEWIGDMQVVLFPSAHQAKLEKAGERVDRNKRNKIVHKAYQQRETKKRKEAVKKERERIERKYAKKLQSAKARMTPFAMDEYRREANRAMRDEIRHIKQS